MSHQRQNYFFYTYRMDFETTTVDMSATWNIAMAPGMEEVFGTIGIIINILSILTYILSSYGLFLINKKLGEKHAWLSFVPLLQIYNYFTASKKSVLHYLVLPILAIIVWTILIIPTFGISIIVAYIYMIVMWILLLHAISKRCGRWAWTTVGFIFVPFIMLPVVWVKLEKTQNAPQKESQPEVVL